MQDRLSMYPGRVKLIPVIGQENTYDMERADEPSQLGTELKKATLLSDETAALLGLTDAATPNTAFAKIKELLSELEGKVGGIEVISYTGTGKFGSEANATSITFKQTPKLLIPIYVNGTLRKFYDNESDWGSNLAIYVPGVPSSYTQVFYWSGISSLNHGLYIKYNTSAKKLSWYISYSYGLSLTAEYQYAASGTKYSWIVVY